MVPTKGTYLPTGGDTPHEFFLTTQGMRDNQLSGWRPFFSMCLLLVTLFCSQPHKMSRSVCFRAVEVCLPQVQNVLCLPSWPGTECQVLQMCLVMWALFCHRVCWCASIKVPLAFQPALTSVAQQQVWGHAHLEALPPQSVHVTLKALEVEGALSPFCLGCSF